MRKLLSELLLALIKKVISERFAAQKGERNSEGKRKLALVRFMGSVIYG